MVGAAGSFFQPHSVYGVCSHLMVKRSTRAALDGLSPSARRFNPDTTSAAPPDATAEEREVAASASGCGNGVVTHAILLLLRFSGAACSDKRTSGFERIAPRGYTARSGGGAGASVCHPPDTRC